VLENNWPDLWHRLSRGGEPPGLGQALADVAAAGLATIRQHDDDASESYAVHPGVAEAGRTHAGAPFRDAADTEAAAFWDAVYRHASWEAGDDGVDTELLVRAGLAAVPYLARQHQWTDAATLLEGAFNRNPSHANAVAVLPAIQQIARHDPSQAGVLATVLRVIDPAAAEAQMRSYLDVVTVGGNYRAASVAAGWLTDLCAGSGRLAEALGFAGQQADYTRRAGLGPWTQLLSEVKRLQVLNEMGKASEVLAEVQRLRDHMRDLPATPGPDEAVAPWSVRWVLLDTGRNAAILLGRWDDALGLNAEVIASTRDRRAPATDIALARLNDYGPLLHLGRTEEALSLLLDCRQAFEDAHDITMLGRTLSALADTEDERGHGNAAIRLERDALRYGYLAGDVTAIAGSYHNLGVFLHDHARPPALALASHLAAALIRSLAGVGGTGINSTDESIRQAATDLGELGAHDTPPADVADLNRQLGDIPGTDLPALIRQLSADPEAAEQALRDLIAKAQELAATPPPEASPDASR
jgi:hypothetical protein